jgi:hypothetical protein
MESDTAEALKAAIETFPNCNDRGINAPAPPVYIVINADHDSHAQTRENQVCGRQLHIAEDGIRVLADGERGCANCFFSVDVIGSDLFRETVRTAALFLVTQQGRIPVHASAVMIGNCAFVLAGRSGSGKSTLALAANQAGLPMLAEDTVFVQLDPAFKIWGLAEHIHVAESDAPPGVKARTRLRSGRIKLALPIGEMRHSAERAALCLLVRGSSPLLDPLPPDDAVHVLLRDPEPGYDLFAASMEKALRAIATGGCWQLTLSHDPRAAIALLIDAFGPASTRQFG